MSKFTHSNRANSKQFLQDMGCIHDQDFDWNSLVKPVLDLLGDEIGKIVASAVAGVFTGGAGAGVIYTVLQASEKALEDKAKETGTKIKDEFVNAGQSSWDDMNWKDKLYTRLRLIRLLYEGITTDKVDGKPVMELIGTNKLDKKKQDRLTARILVLNNFWCNDKDSSMVSDNAPLAEIEPVLFIKDFIQALHRQEHKETGNIKIIEDQKIIRRWTRTIDYFKRGATSQIETRQTQKKQQTVQALGAGIGLLTLLK